MTLVVEEAGNFEPALAIEWSKLWDRCPSATPFQRPEWLLPWCRRLDRGPPWLLSVFQRDRLVGLAPLRIRRGDDGATVISFLGDGITGVMDVLALPEVAGGVVDALLGHLARTAWDRCELSDLPPDSPLRSAKLPDGWTDEVTEGHTRPVLGLPPTLQRLGETVPEATLRRFDVERRRLGRLGSSRLQTVTGPSLVKRLDLLFSLRFPRAPADATVQAFHRDVATGLALRGGARLHLLEVEGRLAAAAYVLSGNRRSHVYIGGFDPDFARQCPGFVVTGAAIEAAVAAGDREFDFLRRSEADDATWGAVDCVGTRRVLRRPN